MFPSLVRCNYDAAARLRTYLLRNHGKIALNVVCTFSKRKKKEKRIFKALLREKKRIFLWTYQRPWQINAWRKIIET